MIKFFKFFLTIVLITSALSLQSQTEPADEAPAPAPAAVEPEPETVEPEKTEKQAIPVNVKKKKAKPEKLKRPKLKEEKKAHEITVDDRADSDLLTIKEGDYLYRRIPDIKIAAPAQTSGTDIVKLPGSEDKDKQAAAKLDEAKSPDGLLGLSGSATDTLVKVFFVVLIIIVFLLYRARSRTGSGGGVGVLRSIPKK